MKYVALLRGINVGGNSKVEMPKLKALFESLGYTEVKTYINSGNVIFSSDKKTPLSLATTIEKGLEKKFHFAMRVIVRDLPNIKRLCAAIPDAYTNDSEQKTDILFLWEEHDTKKVLPEIKVNPDVDMMTYIKGAIIWHIDRMHYNKSGMHKFIGTEVYKHMTARNVNTVRKLRSLMEEI